MVRNDLESNTQEVIAMATSDLIARFIMDSIEESERGFAELQRSALAEMFSCVPSQINYVISTRFSPEHGYVVESRRGGGGYIRISRVRSSPSDVVMGAVKAVGNTLDMSTAAAYVSNFYKAGIIDRGCARLILAAISDKALRPLAPEDRDTLRSSIFKHMLVSLLNE